MPDMSKPVLSVGFDVPFDEAIKWGKDRVSTLPDVYHSVLPSQARSRAFTVSGLSSLDQIQGVLNSLNRSLETGGTFADWQKTLTKEAMTLGPARLDNIFRTAVQTHYNIGRYQQQVNNKAHRPFLMYDAINDGRTRPHHRAMDNYIAPIDDPIWKKWYPPNGFRCRCGTISLTEAQARQRGWIGTPKALPGDVQPDKGWDYNPAEGMDSATKRGTSEKLGEASQRVLMGQDEALAEVVSSKLRQCDAFTFAGKRATKPVWCTDANDHALMIEAWAKRGGAMPAPRTLVLPVLQNSEGHERLFSQFMAVFGETTSARFDLPTGETVVVGSDLFQRLNNTWKLNKRERDIFLLYIAETISRPQEIWRRDLSHTQELYMLARFMRGSERIDVNAVFKRDKGKSLWADGKTAYTFDRPYGIDRKRAELMDNGCVLWVEL